MSNEETLQEYNERLEENNVSLANVLTTIKNLPSSDVPSGQPNIYSTEETVAGIFLDKPLYRKVAIFRANQFHSQTVDIETGILNCDIMINQNTFWFDSQANRWRPMPGNYYSTDNWDSQSSFESLTGRIVFEIGSSALERIKTKATIIYTIFEYTKTTD